MDIRSRDETPIQSYGSHHAAGRVLGECELCAEQGLLCRRVGMGHARAQEAICGYACVGT
ncbi:MAG: hypothetical protein ACI3Z0_10585 [Candidatus Cryptobacteroides sp.]